jgi:hypothetical protein
MTSGVATRLANGWIDCLPLPLIDPALVDLNVLRIRPAKNASAQAATG